MASLIVETIAPVISSLCYLSRKFVRQDGKVL